MSDSNGIPSPITSKVIQASGTNLFALAAQYLGDATRWNEIAALNNLWDPQITTMTTLKIPSGSQPGNGGIRGL